MAVSEKTAYRRGKWKRRILQIIRTEASPSRMVVKKQSGLSMDTTLSLVEELLTEGLIEEVGMEESIHAGRKATLLRVNPEGAYFIGVRFSASGLSAVCTDLLLETVAHVEWDFDSTPGKAEVLQGIDAAIDQLKEQLGNKVSRLRGIGIGAPGVINPETGVVERYVHIPDWQPFPLGEELGRRYGVPVWVEHGVKCTARELAERDGSRNLMLLQISRGLNLCMVSDGVVLGGSSYLSGEIGHVYVRGWDAPCTCGRRGCLETLVSNDALRREVLENLEAYPEIQALDKPLQIRDLCEAANEGSPSCRELLSRAGSALGEVLSGAVALLNPGELVLSGRLCRAEAFCQAVSRELNDHCLMESLRGLKVEFRDSDRLLDAAGAARLPYQRLYGEETDPRKHTLENERG